MGSFKGSFDELEQIVKLCGCYGEWVDQSNAKQFKSNEGGILNWYSSTGSITYQGSPMGKSKLEAALEGWLESASSIAMNTPIHNVREKVFVVHGHDSTAREQLELILHKLGLDPYVLANTSGDGLTIIEALEREIGGCPDAARFGIVLMTPDDMGYSKREGESKTEPRARQNVVLEMGMLLSTLGRQNVAILKKGHLEVPSDANGILYIGFNDHVKETVPRLVDRLNTAGFKIESSAISKASA